jgi:rSAM/selenodomain-associated transferase 2
MLSIIIPTLNAERTLPRTLAALLPGMIEGLVREVIVVDGGSTDRTLEIAESAGVTVVQSEPSRGKQLMVGADQARHDWLLFLHADTVLSEGWYVDVGKFVQGLNGTGENAAAFKFALDDAGLTPRIWEYLVAIRCAVFRLPYGDQGLLISQRLYRRVGGYRPFGLMEDVDLIRRIKSVELKMLDASATTSAEKFKQNGYFLRSMRNLSCLAMYYAGVPLPSIERHYRAKSSDQ